MSTANRSFGHDVERTLTEENPQGFNQYTLGPGIGQHYVSDHRGKTLYQHLKQDHQLKAEHLKRTLMHPDVHYGLHQQYSQR